MIKTGMLRVLRGVRWGRAMAAVVALALAGAPRALAASPRSTAAARAEHRCACPRHAQHADCKCCHGRHGAPREGDGDGTTTSRQVVVGACSAPELPAPPPSGAEAFTLPTLPAVAARPTSEPVVIPVATALEAPRTPESPPPKPA